MSPIAEDDLIGLAAWAMGAFGVGAHSDGKSALDELCSKMEKHPTLPKSAAARMASDLDSARKNLWKEGNIPDCLCTDGIARAAMKDLEEDIRRCPLLTEPARARLLSELGPLRQRDPPGALISELLLMRRLAEAALVLDCFDKFELSMLPHVRSDPLAKHGAVRELLRTSI
ncbi:MAG: hypothetical protein HOP15_18875 [Planctomycetes bacterium]|nr:hypothetical protein [Planctomycetota bacterium]